MLDQPLQHLGRFGIGLIPNRAYIDAGTVLSLVVSNLMDERLHLVDRKTGPVFGRAGGFDLLWPLIARFKLQVVDGHLPVLGLMTLDLVEELHTFLEELIYVLWLLVGNLGLLVLQVELTRTNTIVGVFSHSV